MLKIKETIVVEGKGDINTIARVCEANFIMTSGLHISKKTYAEIELAINTCGIIIFTDPDSAGRSIRNKIVSLFEENSDKIKHANITVKEAKKNGDVGVENASDEALILALKEARTERNNLYSEQRVRENSQLNESYTLQDLIDLGLAGHKDSAKKRQKICDQLRIPYSNAKSLLKKLNAYGIKREEIIK